MRNLGNRRTKNPGQGTEYQTYTDQPWIHALSSGGRYPLWAGKGRRDAIRGTTVSATRSDTIIENVMVNASPE